MQGKYWTLTYNNYNEDTLETWRKVVQQGEALYICFQQEKAPTTGTPHLQGYAVFHKKKRLAAVKKVLGSGVHGILSNGSPSQNRDYCSKGTSSVEGTFEEYGVLPSAPKERQGKRNDLKHFMEAVKKGDVKDRVQARELFPEVTSKYPRFAYDYIDDQKKISVEEHDLYQWQQMLNDLLAEAPDDRKIIFVVDQDGGHGKTWFAKYYCKMHDDAQFMEPAKKQDMAYALKENLRVLFLNVTRTSDIKNQEYLYSFVESVKDGMVFSSKYESRVKYFDKVHVVVMMNTEPNRDLLSRDRYHVVELS